MKLATEWLRSYVDSIPVDDRALADALTLRGIAVDGVFEPDSGRGSLFEMDITTNRVDAMNHYGVAREAAAIFGLPLEPLETGLPAATGRSTVGIRIEAPDLCGRFTARILRGVPIGPSSGVVRERFEYLEQKLISNAVDATNYVVMAMGHPTHAFDCDKLEGGIVVRRARPGEKLKTLDGIERVLDPEDLVVADEMKPVALAGVMGGWDTMITAETRRILVEAAWFNPVSTRRSARRHGIHTEASHRFERGADFQAPPVASALVCRLLLAYGGEIEGDLVDVIRPEAEARTANRPQILLQLSEVGRILGPTNSGSGRIGEREVETILSGLGCGLEAAGSGEFRVSLPSWRLDLEREIDLIEEIARIYGYNCFLDTLPAFSGIATEPSGRLKERTVRESLLVSGWNEAISSSFCAERDAALFAPRPDSVVAVGNPLSEEAGMLRPSLIPGMLAMVANNLVRGAVDVRLFEVGTAFSGGPDSVEEKPALAIAATGSVSEGPQTSGRALDFFSLKGAVENLLERFEIDGLAYETPEQGEAPAWLHPFRAARVSAGGRTLAWLGQLHPEEAQQRKLRQPVLLGEVFLDRLYDLPLRQPLAREISRFQAVNRDFSFIFPEKVLWAQVAGAIGGLRIAEILRFAPREVLRSREGKHEIRPGHYSMLVSVTFQALDRTLREEEIKSYSGSVMAALESLGGVLRS